VLWLRSKLAAGRHDIVAGELRKLHEHLLGPMGVICAPANLDEAVAAYSSARETWERRLGSYVSRNLENTVMPADEDAPGTGLGRDSSPRRASSRKIAGLLAAGHL
jgi:hypothetical protein